MEGPILSIRAAFEAGVNLKASNKRELCKKIPTNPISSRTKSRDVKGTDLFSLKQDYQRKENQSHKVKSCPRDQHWRHAVFENTTADWG